MLLNKRFLHWTGWFRCQDSSITDRDLFTCADIDDKRISFHSNSMCEEGARVWGSCGRAPCWIKHWEKRISLLQYDSEAVWSKIYNLKQKDARNSCRQAKRRAGNERNSSRGKACHPGIRNWKQVLCHKLQDEDHLWHPGDKCCSQCYVEVSLHQNILHCALLQNFTCASTLYFPLVISLLCRTVLCSVFNLL